MVTIFATSPSDPAPLPRPPQDRERGGAVEGVPRDDRPLSSRQCLEPFRVLLGRSQLDIHEEGPDPAEPREQRGLSVSVPSNPPPSSFRLTVKTDLRASRARGSGTSASGSRSRSNLNSTRSLPKENAAAAFFTIPKGVPDDMVVQTRPRLRAALSLPLKNELVDLSAEVPRLALRKVHKYFVPDLDVRH